jgi:chromosome segregation ATPase
VYHQEETKVYKQQLKHLMSEHVFESTQAKLKAERILKLIQDDNRIAEIKLKDDRRKLGNFTKDVDFSSEEYLRSLRREQDIRITQLRHEFERRAKEIQETYDARMKDTRDALDRHRLSRLSMISERKEKMVAEYMSQHTKALTDIKTYYSEITRQNLELISHLKEELKDIERAEKEDEIRKNERTAEYKKLQAPLKESEEQIKRLEGELISYKDERAALKHVKTNLDRVEGTRGGLLWEFEVIQQRFVDLKRERDELRQSFMSSVFDVKQKSSFRGVLLEKKLAAIQMVQEEHEAQLNEVLSRANIDPTLLGQVKGKSGDVLLRKSDEVRKLQNEYLRLQTKRNDLVRAVENKLGEFGLRSTELGFESTMTKLKL